jgi:hypothetical protein
MKKKCAVYTIVKNEDYFLPKWIKHFSKYFDKSDIYILDHQSDDDSTSNLDVNVTKVINDLAFDHQWLLNTVENYQSVLLEKYECVLFAEVDELLYCTNKPLNEMIDDFLQDDIKYLTAHGYEIKQHNGETPISVNDEMMINRNYWFESWMYGKTLLSKVKLNWVWGFHYARVIKEKYMWDENNILERIYKNKEGLDYGLNLIHLHRCDFELMYQRHEVRSIWKQKFDGGGNHNRTSDRRVLEQYFNDIQGEVVKIPEDHKKQLYGI